MSSVVVRNLITNFLTTELPSENFIDISGQFDFLKDLIASAGVGPSEAWVGFDFIGGEENPITVPATNTTGKYREDGAVYIHVVDIAKLGVTSSILTRAEALRNLLRGRRIGNLVIQSVTPPNFGPGATLSFDAGYTSASFLAAYECDLDL